MGDRSIISCSVNLQSKYIKKTDLITERKWTRFPEKEIRYKESTEITLGDFFEIKRGLATGDNSFFIMSRKKIIELGLDMSFFKPILVSSFSRSSRYDFSACVR